MKVNIGKKEFVDGLKKVNKAISNRGVNPVLSNVLINANKNGFSLTGSNSDLSVITNVPFDEESQLKIEIPGAIALPAKELTAIVRSLPGDTVSLDLDKGKNKVKITAEKSHFNLNGIGADQYPKIAQNFNSSFQVKGELLKKLLDKTGYSSSNQETRPILMGVNLIVENGMVKAVSTDTHRLSNISKVGEIEGNFEGNIVLPPKAVKELPALIGDDDVVVVKNGDNQMMVEINETTVISRLLTGTYPETDRLIPTNFSTELTVNREGFTKSLERSIVLANEDSSVKFEISDEKNGMFETIKLSTNTDLGNSSESIFVEQVKGESLTISFNAEYLIEALKKINEEEVKISFSGSMRPFVVRPINSDYQITKLILPVRTY